MFVCVNVKENRWSGKGPEEVGNDLGRLFRGGGIMLANDDVKIFIFHACWSVAATFVWGSGSGRI